MHDIQPPRRTKIVVAQGGDMDSHKPGLLFAIGGNEQKQDHPQILGEFVDSLQGKRVIIATVASREPDGYFDEYAEAFRNLGITDIEELSIQDRSEAHDDSNEHILENASGIFFSGGNQVLLEERLKNTPVFEKIYSLWAEGCVIGGTSAGASVMGELMIANGAGDTSYSFSDVQTAPGLGFVSETIIDQHFAERGRFGRLIGAVVLNNRMLGLGIDEDTAIIIDEDRFTVTGAGSVYVMDACEVSMTSPADLSTNGPLSVYDLRLHVLSAGESFDLAARSHLHAAKQYLVIDK